MGNVSESGATYARHERAEAGGRGHEQLKRLGGFGGFGGLGSGSAKVDVASTAAGVAGSAYSIQKNFEFYRESILYATYSLGLGRVAYHGGNLEGARKNFQDALDVLGSNLPGIGKVGQIRRFRVAARTALGDVALRSNKPKDASASTPRGQRRRRKTSGQTSRGHALRGRAAPDSRSPRRSGPAQAREVAGGSARPLHAEAVQIIETLSKARCARRVAHHFLATLRSVRRGFVRPRRVWPSLPGAAAARSKARRRLRGEAFRVVEQGRARSSSTCSRRRAARRTEGILPSCSNERSPTLDRQQRDRAGLSGRQPTGEPPKESVE